MAIAAPLGESATSAADAADKGRTTRWWVRAIREPRVATGVAILVIFALLAIFGPMLDPIAPNAITGSMLAPPSLAHWLGTTQESQDVLSQLISGAHVSMEVGFAVGLFATLASVIIGVTSGYLVGVSSEALSLVSNVFLVLPTLPLVVVLAGFLGNKTGSWAIILVISVTAWAWGARVLRAQTLSLRRRDFVEAARATGEAPFKTIFYDILTNELAIITVTFLGTVIGAILIQASIAFLGLGNVTQWSWGTMLYWAQSGGAVLSGAWWWFVPPGLCIALVGIGLGLINFGLDEVVNPRLRASGASRSAGRRASRIRLSARRAARSLNEKRKLEGTPHRQVEDVLLEVNGLSVEYAEESRPVRAVDDVSIILHRGEVLGVAGESGSGKSTLARAVTRLLRDPAEVVAGEMLYTRSDGRKLDMLALDDRELRDFRWEEVAIVFQSAMNALNPILRLGVQIDDVLRAHRSDMNRWARAARVAELLSLVGISPDRASAYPHELSGGMRQRAMIALGLALDPDIIVMDEPTTALDVVTQRQIIQMILELKRSRHFSVIFITHDLSLLMEICDTIVVMYAGRIVEVSSGSEFYQHPRHPYSQALLRSFPTLTGDIKELVEVPGSPPDMRRLPAGCAFRARCPSASQRCAGHVPVLTHAPSSTDSLAKVACVLYGPEAEGTHDASEGKEYAR